MGISSDGVLVYGIHLGSLVDGDFECPEFDEDGSEDFESWAENRLLESVGFTETAWQAAKRYQRKANAIDRLKVKIVSHCSYDYPIYFLALNEIYAYRGYPKQLDPSLLQIEEGQDSALTEALVLLNIKVEDSTPHWWLASLWG